MSWITHSFGILALLPFVPFAAVWLLSSYLTGNKKTSFKMAMDVTTLFLIASVASLYNLLFHSSLGMYGIILIMLIFAGLAGSAMYRKHGKVNRARLFRASWRISFFLLSVSYVFLVIIGIIVYTAQV
ncbi:DUF3397 domain-containing protein [Paenibacillus marinisediminis]